MHLEKSIVMVHTTGQALPGLFAVVFLLVGDYPFGGINYRVLVRRNFNS
jgi:hypothetical protein